ncbi:MAG: hypothetical protein WBF51_04610, partial [Candidatus Dormiibacterota bacterium]
RNLWEHTALAALEATLLSEKPGAETVAVEEVIRLVEGSVAIAARVSEDNSGRIHLDDKDGHLLEDADLAGVART